MGDLDGALADYEAALRSQPDFPEALASRAAVLGELGRYNEALAGINRYLALRPDDARAEVLHEEMLKARIMELVDEGFLDGVGGKLEGSPHPLQLTPGPPISDYIVDERERLRG